jgi:hypothetical protein
MGEDRCDLITALQSDLSFMERGGYWGTQSPSWRHPLIFQDSPTCLSRGRPSNARACAQCVLLPLVPAEHREGEFPCRCIPLNGKGETHASRCRSRSQEEVESVVASWLRAKIRELSLTVPAEDAKMKI